MSFLNNLSTFITQAARLRDVLSTVRSIINEAKGRPADVLPINNIQTTASTVSIIKNSDTETQAQEQAVNPGVRLQFDPNTETKLPVLYGRATMGGAVTDVELVNNNTELQVCLALAMITGNKIDGTPRTYEFFNVFMDNQRLNFRADGQVIESATDTEGNINTAYDGKLGVYFYASSSEHVLPNGSEDTGILVDARNVFEGWTTNHFMTGILFAIVRIAWDPDLGFDRFPDFQFDIANSMTLPGDCLFDYLTNDVYGCGIPLINIKATSI